MKNLTFKIAALAAVLLSLAGCRDGEIPNNFYLNVAPNTAQSVAASATSFNFIVGTNVMWEVYVDGELKHTGAPGENQSWQLTMPANESITDEVVYNLVFKSADLAYNMIIPVTVTQEVAVEPPYLRVDPSTDQTVSADVTSFDFTVEANVSWSVKVDGGQQGSGVADQTVTVTFPANEDTTGPATRTVVFESTDPDYTQSYTIEIVQEAAVEPPYLRVDPSADQTVGANITSFDFAVEANVSWSVKVDGGLQDSGDGDKTVTVTFPANEDITGPATRTVVFESTDPDYTQSYTIDIVQDTAPYLIVDPSADQTVAADITSFDFTVEANVSWSVKVDGGQQDSGDGDKTVTVTFPANEDTTGPATRTVVFESTDPDYTQSYTIEITQAKKPVPIVTYTETFSGFTKINSSYTGTGDYTSTEVTGVVWSYKGATNQSNAKFVLGKNADGNTNPCFVKTNTVSGGVSYIAVDWIIPFNDGGSGYNGTSFKVMVNGTKVGDHTVAKSGASAGVKGTLVIDNLDITGDAVISIESNGAGRPGVNKVVWKTNP